MLLIIHKSERQGRPLTDMLRYMGFIAYHAKPAEALSEISTRYRAVLLLHPASLPDPQDYLCRLRSYAADIPFFAVTEDMDTVAGYADAFARLFHVRDTAAHIVEGITDTCRALHKEVPGVYRLCGIDASVDLVECRYLRRALPLTATEARIVRFLICAFPNRVSASEMVKYIFSPTKRPQISSMRTHISSINRKFRELTDARVLIDLAMREGYRIKTPVSDEQTLLFM